MSYSWLPPLLNEIADVAGVDAALALAEARGGSRVSFPARVKKGHWLIDAVGEDAAEKLCDHFRTGTGHGTGAVLDLPIGPSSSAFKTRRKVDALIKSGLSADKIAVEAGVHRNTVFRRKREMDQPNYSAQMDMFAKFGNE